MKRIELPAYRAFMFAAVPQLALAHPLLGQVPFLSTIQYAINTAEDIWDAIDVHVLKVAEKLEND